MNTKRLTRTRDMLLELKARGVTTEPDRDRHQFDIATWGTKGYEHCGTVACIGGWATLDPVLRAEGLFRVGDTSSGDPGDMTPMVEPLDSFGLPVKPLVAYDALMDFYDLGYTTADYIFSGHNTNDLDKAVARIDRVLAGYKPSVGERT